MPTVTRFLSLIVTLAALVLAVTLALAYLVPPDTRPMTAPVEASALGSARPIDPPPPAPAAPATGLGNAGETGNGATP